MNSPGKIYLSDLRGLTENSQLRRYSVFNYLDYYNPERIPFGAITLFNEGILAALQSVSTVLPDSYNVVIIPLTGALSFTLGNNKSDEFLEPGEIRISTVKPNEVLEVSNPYEKNWINYLEIWIKASQIHATGSAGFKFNFSEQKNQLIPVVPPGSLYGFSVHMGMFDGRTEVLYPTDGKQKTFIQVICGVFEIQGRLVDEKDSLALWDADNIEIEALSNYAIILLISS
jgi:hypothetical protein